MGCGTSLPGPAGALGPRERSVGSAESKPPPSRSIWRHPSGLALKDWSAEEVDSWYMSLPVSNVEACKGAVLGGMDGAFVSKEWTEKFLEAANAGLTVVQIKQLLALHDKAAADPIEAPPPSALACAADAVAGVAPGVATVLDATTTLVVAAANALPSGAQEVFRTGIKAFRFILKKAGPMLPFPGADGVLQALISLLGLVEDTMDVANNVNSLRDRAFDLLEVMVANAAALHSNDKDKAIRLFSKFKDILKEVISYATEHTGRNWAMKVLTSGGDATHFNDLQKRLKDLVADATLGIAAETQTQVAAVLDRIHAASVFVDQGIAARNLVEKYGGMEKVLDNPTHMAEVTALMETGQQVNAMLIQQAMSMVAAANDEGIHGLIKQADMSVFWRKNFKPMPEVKWKHFWAAFPAELTKNPMSAEVVGRLQAALGSEEARATFRKHVNLDETVDVTDIQMSFLPDADLLSTVEALACTIATASVAGEAVVSTLFHLPHPDALYGGRDTDAAEVVRQLTPGGQVVCLVAQAGMGKSSLALDVGARLWRDGLIPSGARFVDMREARSTDDVLSRFCASLEIVKEGDIAKAILVKLRQLAAHQGPLLLLVDNAEDVLRADGDVAKAFAALLDQVAGLGRECVLLMVTSREELSLHCRTPLVNRDLSHLDEPAALALVQSIATDLTSAEAATVAKLSRCIPLLLRLVSGALAAGRIVMQEVQQQLSTASSAAVADLVEATVYIMLMSLPKNQQLQLVQLSVFPSGFDDEGAADVMGVETYRARGTIQVLYGHGLVMFDTAKRLWQLHMAVKTTAQQLPLMVAFEGSSVPYPLGPGVLQIALRSFVIHTMKQLGQWGVMYLQGGASTQLALQLARAQHPNTQAAFAYLASTQATLEVVAALCAANATDFFTGGLGMHKDTTYMSAWRNQVDAVPASMRDTVQYACVLMGYGEGLGRLEKNTEAVRVFSQVLEMRTRLLGTDHLDTLHCMTKLARIYLDTGGLAVAAPLLVKVREVRMLKLGAEHIDTLTSSINLAMCLWDQGKDDEAEAMHREALEIATRVLGAEHPNTMLYIGHLAYFLTDRGRYQEAEPMQRQLLETRVRVLGPEHPGVAFTAANLIQCLNYQGKRAEAEVVRRQVEAMGSAQV